MLHYIKNIVDQSIPRVITSSIVNGYLGLKNFLMGASTPLEATTDFSKAAGKDTACEVVRVVLNEGAMRMVPGGKVAQSIAKTAADISIKGVRAGIEGDAVGRTMLKNGLYALNTAVAGPVMAFPLAFATDYAVDQTADGINHAYTNYKHTKEHRAFQKGYTVSDYEKEFISERVTDDLESSFIMVSPAA